MLGKIIFWGYLLPALINCIAYIVIVNEKGKNDPLSLVIIGFIPLFNIVTAIIAIRDFAFRVFLPEDKFDEYEENIRKEKEELRKVKELLSEEIKRIKEKDE